MRFVFFLLFFGQYWFWLVCLLLSFSSSVPCSLTGLFSWNYTKYMWVNFVPSGVLCFLMPQMMLSFFTGISFTPRFPGETSSWDSTLKENFCVSEMAVEVGYSLVVLGATWGALEFIPTIDMSQLFSFLLGMLLAFPVVGNIASSLAVVTSDRGV